MDFLLNSSDAAGVSAESVTNALAIQAGKRSDVGPANWYLTFALVRVPAWWAFAPSASAAQTPVPSGCGRGLSHSEATLSGRSAPRATPALWRPAPRSPRVRAPREQRDRH
jgi:hypothetical protein